VIGRVQPQVYATGALPLVGKIYDITTGLVCASVVIEDKCGAKGWVSQELYEPFRVTVSDVCHVYVTITNTTPSVHPFEHYLSDEVPNVQEL
jgi:hypothetical protein